MDEIALKFAASGLRSALQLAHGYGKHSIGRPVVKARATQPASARLLPSVLRIIAGDISANLGVYGAEVKARLAEVRLACRGGHPHSESADAHGLSGRWPRREEVIELGGYFLDDAVEFARSRYRAKAVKAETEISGCQESM